MIESEARELLERIFDPQPLDPFLDEIVGKRFVKIAPRDPAARMLLGPNPENLILNAFAHLAPKLGCHAAKPLAPPPPIGAVANAWAFKARIDAFHANGYTVRLPEMRVLAPDLDRFLRALELTFHQPVKAEAFWSRGDAAAPVHYDDYDIIVIQLRGRKRWFISTDPSPLPNEWKTILNAAPALERFAEVEVGPGDMLYLPRGTTHRVDALSDSLHLSIGFVPLTLREAILACLDHLSDLDRPLRETIGARAGTCARTDAFGEIPSRVREGIAALATRSNDDRFVSDALQHRASRTVSALDRLQTPVGHPALTISTRLRHNPRALSHIIADGTKLDLAYPGGHLLLPRDVESAVAFIAATPAFAVNDIPGTIDDDLRLALAEKFLASGFLEVAES
jgi:bifunctional lysine-specific demethylase and histidyl-hydroxylase MINA